MSRLELVESRAGLRRAVADPAVAPQSVLGAEVDEARRMRIGYYDQRVTEAVEAVRAEFPDLPDRGALWHQIKLAYMPLLYEHRQPECAETFYNSVACRVLDRTYYRNDYIL